MLFNSEQKAHGFRIASKRAIFAPMSAANLVPLARRTVSIFLAGLLLASPVFGATLSANEQEIDGIIGADILFPTKAVLDCQQQLLILKTDPDVAGGAPGFDRRGLRAVPIQVSDGFNLYVNGSINGAAAKLMIDTGSFATLLHRSFVRRMRIATRETPFSSSAVNLKERGVQVARIRKLSVGAVDIIGKEVGVIDLEGLIHGGLLRGSPPVAGLLGGEILNRHHGIIDFGTRTLYLKR